LGNDVDEYDPVIGMTNVGTGVAEYEVSMV
jgi:hypothetical protein